jgi:hypothetical protein
MKTLLKVIGVILAVLVLLLVVARVTGFEPNGPRPGLWLKGNLVTTPVADWSFTDNIHDVEIQTNPGICFRIPLPSIVSPTRGSSTWPPSIPRDSYTPTAGAGTRT